MHNVFLDLKQASEYSIVDNNIIREKIVTGMLKGDHEAHYHQRLFLEAWMSVKDLNAGNDHMVIPEVYKCLART